MSSANNTFQKSENDIRILVVEDNLLNQKLVGFILTDWGYKYDISIHGKSAIENLRLNTYDLILMDIQMPEMNGHEITEYIRKKLKLEMPIIAMSAHAMPGEKEKCLKVGMTDYIAKPLNETELLNLITRYLFSTISKNRINMSPIKNDIKNVINLDYLIELSKGNMIFIKEMTDTFLVENPKEIHSLEKAIRNRNFGHIKQSAHFLQSSIPFVGLDKIIENEVYEIERIAADRVTLHKNESADSSLSDIQQIEKLFSKIKETCEKACLELQA